MPGGSAAWPVSPEEMWGVDEALITIVGLQ
jgi:hypothetical protein